MWDLLNLTEVNFYIKRVYFFVHFVVKVKNFFSLLVDTRENLLKSCKIFFFGVV